ncbi:fumarylacetoacetate hydrolase family protein [Pseudofrankia sp. BMG5.36]|uniref:2-keto-4-pentenoate hydratase n=1 Tax=Pseudofrankia sp. BMG5.36 TaxID=1834512 RepID=UPI0008D94684|nr:fumarylacetoacetate hydrolase family protein [Pseudofrankia sp. BMG5.36]OHV44597.1 hypothetical protein BCD48_25455 [Pseudofrankia sp. BMG5.36]
MAAPSTVPAVVQQASERLRLAGSLRRSCPPVRDLIDEMDLDTAYAVQRHVTELQLISGARPVGRKIGMTSPAVQRQLGVSQPNSGVLLDTMHVNDGAAVATSRLLQPLIEAELAVVLRADLDGDDLTLEDVRSAVGTVHAALEIVDSRIEGWDITIVDTIADNASSGVYVISSDYQQLGDRDLRTMEMELRRNGTVVSAGTGAACLGDPLHALAWLAATAQAQGVPLRAGETVLTGALGPMVPIAEGDTFTGTIGDLRPVSVRFLASAELLARGVERGESVP